MRVSVIAFFLLVLTGVQTSAQTIPRKAGGFVVQYQTPVSPSAIEWTGILKESHLLEEVARFVNESVRVPRRISIVLMTCGEVDAFYDPQRIEIHLCVELLDDLNAKFAEEENDSIRTAEVLNAGLFIVMHEVGHALVDQLGLTVIVREEDVVDGIAAYLLLDEDESGVSASPILNGAAFFVSDEGEDFDDSTFADEHSLGPQRFYNLLCYAYGSDSARYSFLVEDGILPKARATRCEQEWLQLKVSMGRLLLPHRNP